MCVSIIYIYKENDIYIYIYIYIQKASSSRPLLDNYIRTHTQIYTYTYIYIYIYIYISRQLINQLKSGVRVGEVARSSQPRMPQSRGQCNRNQHKVDRSAKVRLWHWAGKTQTLVLVQIAVPLLGPYSLPTLTQRRSYSTGKPNLNPPTQFTVEKLQLGATRVSCSPAPVSMLSSARDHHHHPPHPPRPHHSHQPSSVKEVCGVRSTQTKS